MGASIRPPQRSPLGDALARPETTVLTPDEQEQFRVWLVRNQIRDLDAPESHYDYRGAFKDQLQTTVNEGDGLPHWPDTYKQHGHPTFSVESRYSRGPGDGGTWQGETFTPDRYQAAMLAEALQRAPRVRAAAADNTRTKGR